MPDVQGSHRSLEGYHIEQLRFLLAKFKKVQKTHRLQAVKYTIYSHLERYEKENDQLQVSIFTSLKEFIDSVNSLSELERLIAIVP
jgi:hypothetical protein